jgi:hypothetical protein
MICITVVNSEKLQKHIMLRKLFTQQKAHFSAVPNPRVEIVESLAKLSSLASSKNEASLAAAVKDHKVDQDHFPEHLKELKTYIEGAKTVDAATFVENKNAWQNMPLPSMIAKEAFRHDTWPFIVAGVM